MTYYSDEKKYIFALAEKISQKKLFLNLKKKIFY